MGRMGRKKRRRKEDDGGEREGRQTKRRSRGEGGAEEGRGRTERTGVCRGSRRIVREGGGVGREAKFFVVCSGNVRPVDHLRIFSPKFTEDHPFCQNR
jgi:hypothetical protein